MEKKHPVPGSPFGILPFLIFILLKLSLFIYFCPLNNSFLHQIEFNAYSLIQFGDWGFMRGKSISDNLLRHPVTMWYIPFSVSRNLSPSTSHISVILVLIGYSTWHHGHLTFRKIYNIGLFDQHLSLVKQCNNEE